MRNRILFLPILFFLGSCAVTGGWQFKKETGDVQLYMQEYPDSAIPEFRATVKIHSSIEKIMMVLSDFSGYPDWVYRCKSARVIKLVDFTEAYIYEVIALPLVRDRDMVIHAQTLRAESGDEMMIRLNAVPDYCNDQDTEPCRKVNKSGLVRVRQSTGSFHLRRIDEDWVEVTWQQHLDPGGLIPAWATRLNLGATPLRSLNNLKAKVERENVTRK